MTTTDGIHGFREGRKVAFVREERGEFIVSDGDIQGRAPKDSFTNNLDLVEQISRRQREVDEAAGIVRMKTQAAAQAKMEQLESQRQANVKAARNDNIRRRIEQLDANIAAASQALGGIYRAKARGGDIYNQSGVKVGTRSSSASGNAFQLEQSIKTWQRQKAALQQQLKQ